MNTDTQRDYIKDGTRELLARVGYDATATTTLYDAAKWLRYEQDISVEPISIRKKGTDRGYRVFINSSVTETGDFPSYEDALEFGIITACRQLRKQQNSENENKTQIIHPV